MKLLLLLSLFTSLNVYSQYEDYTDTPAMFESGVDRSTGYDNSNAMYSDGERVGSSSGPDYYNSDFSIQYKAGMGSKEDNNCAAHSYQILKSFGSI